MTVTKRYPVQLPADTYDRINTRAAANGRSIVGEIKWLLDAIEKGYKIISIETIAHPPDATPVEIVHIAEKP